MLSKPPFLFFAGLHQAASGGNFKEPNASEIAKNLK